MSGAVAIVCERTGRWAIALRRGGLPTGGRLIETRTLGACREQLREWPRAVTVCEATEHNLPQVLRFLVELQATAPGARVAVVGPRMMERHELLLREAGAIHAVFSPRRLNTANAMLDRQTVRQSPEAASMEEFAWSRLPWGE